MREKTVTDRIWLGMIVLAAAVLFAYLPALRAGFVWDDTEFLTANPLIKAGDGLRRFWFTTEAADYWPVTSSSLWLEWRLWGDRPLGYHATNVALHLAEVLLLWAVLRRLKFPGAWFAALLFAVHPVNVESVAWITQRKNLMAMLFFLLSLWWAVGWISPRAQTAAGDQAAVVPPFGQPAYWLSLAAFALALLSKASVVMLPLVLLGLILWRRRLRPSDGLALGPFFAAAAVFAALNVWIESRHLPTALAATPPLARVLRAAAAVWFYLFKAVWPARLMFIYPQWAVHPGQLRWWLPLAAAAAVTMLLWRWRRGKGRPWLFAWGYYGVALAPALGLADVTFMWYSPVADHYQHLALIGVVALAAFGWQRWWSAPGQAGWAAAVAAAAVAALVVVTRAQCAPYRNAETLFTAALDANPDAWLAHNDLGLILFNAGKTMEAGKHFQEAVRINPDCAEAHNNLGMALARVGQGSQASDEYAAALRLNPDYPEAHNNLGAALAASGQLTEGIRHLREAVRLQPGYTAAHYNLAIALANAGDPQGAAAEFRRVLELGPSDAEAKNDLRQITGGI